MKKLVLLLVVVFSSVSFVLADTARITEAYGKAPLAFTLNRGQTDSQVRFTASGNGCSMFFTPTGTTLVLSRETNASIAKRSAQKRAPVSKDMMAGREASREYESFSLKTVFVGANSNPDIVGEEKLPWNNNYFIGKDRSQWRTDIPNYSKIRLLEVYKGIDLVYYGNKNRMKYDFVVKSGENPSHIVLKYDMGDTVGDALSINTSGELVIKTPLGEIRESKPYAYQKVNGKELAVDIQYNIFDGAANTFGFKIGTYNSEYDLYVDPELAYSTFLGVNSEHINNKIAIDSSGNVYITGYSQSPDYPVTPGAYDTSLESGHGDAFVTKLNASGTALVYSTFLGGGGSDAGDDIAVDGAGNAYITGGTYSSDYPITPGAYHTGDDGEHDDAFITKLNASGNSLIYSTSFGGLNDDDEGIDIAIDSAGNAYIMGYTFSNDYPSTPQAYESRYHVGQGDIFVTKLNASGTALVYSTFWGGSGYDCGKGMALDSAGNVYITGYTYSTDFPVRATLYPVVSDGYTCVAFVTKLNAGATRLEYSTILYGGDEVAGNSIAVDGAGNAYITGITSTSDYPVTAGSYDTSFNGGGDAFVTKLDASGTVLVYSTFLGGDSKDEGTAIAVDSAGNAYITGSTQSSAYPATAGAYGTNSNGGGDAFVTKLNESGNSLAYSTFLGGNVQDEGTGIAVDNTGNAYIAGSTQSSAYPTTAGAYSTHFNSGREIFVTKLNIGTPGSVTVTAPNGGESWTAGSTHAITWNSSNITNVKLEYSTSTLAKFILIASSVPASRGSYSWIVPLISSSACKVRISDVSNSAVNDISDATFTIGAPGSVKVTAPNGGESWTAGSSHNITWSSSNITNVKLEYSSDGGTKWTMIAASTTASTGSYTWIVPNISSSTCKVRISDVMNAAVTDNSNSNFTIGNGTAGAVTVTSPNGGESWMPASTHPITWNASNITNVKLEYTSNGGTTWTTITSSVKAVTGSYSWISPNILSSTCKVRISDTSNATVNDISDNNFTIGNVAQGTVTVTSPNGGESWTAGSSYSITWNASNITNVKLEYTTNGGTTWTTIAASRTASAGSYTWLVPNISSSTCKVRISDTSKATVNDVSENNFIIMGAQSLTVTVGTVSGATGSIVDVPFTVTGGGDLYSSLLNVLFSASDLDLTTITAGSGVSVEWKRDVSLDTVSITALKGAGVGSSPATICTLKFYVKKGAGFSAITLLNTSRFYKNDDTVLAANALVDGGVTVGNGTQIAGARGDVNNDSMVDVRDALHVLRMSVSSPVIIGGAPVSSPYTPALKYRADVNGNSSVQSSDATLILRKHLGINANLYPLSSAGKAAFEVSSLQLIANGGLGGTTVKFQLAASDIEHIASGDFTIRFNPYFLEFESFENETLFNGMNYEYNVTEPGVLRVAMAQANGITNRSVDLFGLTFRIIGSANLTNDSIRLEEGLLWNEESKAVPATLKNTSLTTENSQPRAVLLLQNIPNPFNPTTAIEFSLLQESLVTLKIHNLSGQEVANLIEETMSAGRYTVVWNARGMPSGIYFYTIKSLGYSQTKKMMLLK